MKCVHITEAARVHHAALVQRISAIHSVGVSGDRFAITDHGERDGGARGLRLRKHGTCRLTRGSGSAQLELHYNDGSADIALAAAVAAATRPGMPVALDPQSLAVLALADKLAGSEIPVLITGPTGTGKEVLSRFIHERSGRADGPFIAVNCAAMPETMLEAMLFGHVKGAFTGASAGGEGFFRAADGGTLLLDEIAELPLALQAKLLRALQEGEVVPIGATRPVKVDVRIIACANRDLPGEVDAGRFRPDLYYRLNVFPLALCALRERVQDIAPLAFAMVLRHTPPGRPVPWIGEAALAMLRMHEWPGNIRELENVMRRALLLADGCERIRPEHVVFDPAARPADAPLAMQEDRGRLSNIVQISEARAIMAALEACGGRRALAARELGISERTLRYRLASFREAGIAVAGGAR